MEDGEQKKAGVHLHHSYSTFWVIKHWGLRNQIRSGSGVASAICCVTLGKSRNLSGLHVSCLKIF